MTCIHHDERDEYGFGCYMDGKWLVDVLLPGFIVADSARQFGAPTLVGTRIPTYVGLGWVWEVLDRAEEENLTREQIIALAAFEAGVEWQRSRKRRKRMAEAVDAGWAEESEMRWDLP